ncbi:MAG: hypothetical protein QW404_00720, partial [Candidatus Nanoarchaeia archaeon]
KRGIIIFLALSLVLSLVLSGCANEKKNVRKLTNYIGGTDGLAISFSKNAPPDKVLDDRQEDFDVAIFLENKGEYTIENGRILATLSGIDREVFNLPSLSARNKGDLERRVNDRGVIREGGKDEISFGTATITQDFANDFTTDIVADICYDYRTVAVASICLKKETLQLKTTDACLIDNEKVDFENSGAPVQVTHVETRKAGRNSVKVTFMIENKGAGETYLQGTFTDSCSGHEKDEAKVHVSLTAPSPRISFKCDLFDGSSQGNVKLYDKKRQVSCTIDTSSVQETAFEAPINIQIDYTYRNAIFKEITIENANVL